MAIDVYENTADNNLVSVLNLAVRLKIATEEELKEVAVDIKNWDRLLKQKEKERWILEGTINQLHANKIMVISKYRDRIQELRNSVRKKLTEENENISSEELEEMVQKELQRDIVNSDDSNNEKKDVEKSVKKLIKKKSRKNKKTEEDTEDQGTIPLDE